MSVMAHKAPDLPRTNFIKADHRFSCPETLTGPQAAAPVLRPFKFAAMFVLVDLLADFSSPWGFP